MNVEELDEREQRLCYGPTGKPFPVTTIKGEESGRYFHPLLATLITGAARLMLAISETLAVRAGLNWALCDIPLPEAADYQTQIKAKEQAMHLLN